MADDDNFDIDIYGDDPNPDYAQEQSTDDTVKQGDAGKPSSNVAGNGELVTSADAASVPSGQEATKSTSRKPSDAENQQISSTSGPLNDQIQPPKQAPVQQGGKAKDGNDDRPVDPGATSAVVIADLHWWTTEDDIRGWSNQAGVEDELQEVTFNEHKVNGKSKGQAYVVLASPQAATALKSKIESFSQGQQYAKKHAITYHASHINPYKTLPKDVPGRKDGRQDNRGSAGNYGNQNNSQNYNRGNYGSGRGGNYNNRGNMGMGYNTNRNFSSSVGGMPNSGFGGNPMANFGGNTMGAMPQFGNFNRGGMMGAGMRGGMMANRGGRVGMNPGMMGGMGMAMGGMGIGGMGMGAMGGMGNMGMGAMQGLSNATHMNPAFFNQGQASPGDNWNPHGAKRPRPE